MVLGMGFVLVGFVGMQRAALAALGNFIGDYVTGKELFLKALNFIISLGIITALFTMVFKFLPDVKIAWRDVWLGGFITAILFNVGKFLIGIYIGRSSISSVYGTMGSLVVVLVWVYYSAQILFFRRGSSPSIYASKFGVKPQPIGGAEFIPPEVKHCLKSAAK